MWKGPGESRIESVISKSPESSRGMSKSLYSAFFKGVMPGEPGARVQLGEGSAKIIDFGSLMVGISSESESVGVMVGGTGCDV